MGSCFSKSEQQNSKNENAPPRENINRPVDVAPQAKKDDGRAKEGGVAGESDKKGEKKEDKGDEKKEDKGDEKKELAEGGGGASTAMVVNKMEHSGYPYAAAPSMPYLYDSELRVHKHNKYVMEAWEHQALFNQHNMPIEQYPPHLIGCTGM